MRMGFHRRAFILARKHKKSLSPAGQKEIVALFPELLLLTFMPKSCRPIIRGKRARKLAGRLSQNSKPLVDEQRMYA
jgi:hypothetical protein